MSAQLKELDKQLHLRTPGLVALEHHPEGGGAFGHIDIPKFGRRLAFPARADGRRVEYVPPDIAQYMIQRFNRNGVVHLTIAYDLMGENPASGGGSISQEQFTAMLQQAVTEPWFAEAVRTAVYAGLGAGAGSSGPQVEDDKPNAPYTPKKRVREG